MKRTFALILMMAGCTTPAETKCQPACAEGYVCMDGACVLGGGGGPDMAMGADGGAGKCDPACGGLTPYCNAGGHCVGCTMDAQCPQGKYCKVVSDTQASCVLGCMSDDRCGGGKCCNNTCADVATDSTNCGSCGNTCAADHAQVRCVNGQCAQAECDPGWGDCNGDAKDGCEANLHSDPKNCTACGSTCALTQAINACADGCYVSACNFGYDNCDDDDKNGCETKVLTDLNNCGGCGKSCTGLPNATANCASGNCILGMCKPGFENCDGNPMNGCEADLQRDAKNCNGCGNVCAQGLFCVQGVCKMGCLMGMGPPQQCLMDVDPDDGKSKWVICQADCNGAWIAANTGGTYHAGHICRNLGYSKVGQYGGTCGNVCGYCEGATSCMANGKRNFDNGGLQGQDQYGPILSFTVMWTCVP